jgi:DNA-binding NarL/FixJ family response regulator
MFRQGVKEMLSTDERIEVVGEAENGREAVALAEKLAPDVVLLDVEMPLMGAREAMGRLLANPPSPRVIIVTTHDEPRVVRELIGLGASAYLVKSATMEELLTAVHTPQTARPGRRRTSSWSRPRAPSKTATRPMASPGGSLRCC